MDAASRLAWGFLAVLAVGGVLVEWKQKKPLIEEDTRRAMRDDRRAAIAKSRRRPRWEKKLEAYWRRGNQILNRESEAK